MGDGLLNQPPLHAAARRGDHGCIRALVAAGAHVNEAAPLGDARDAYPRSVTPFMVAAGSAEGATVETLRLLVSLGADADRRIELRSAMSYAAGGLGPGLGGDAARLRFFLDRGTSELSDREPEILALAIESRDAERVELLLDHGVYPDVLPGYTSVVPGRPEWRLIHDLDGVPLCQAARMGSEAVVRLLLARGADVHIVDRRYRSAMYHTRSPGAARALAAAGLGADSPPWNGETARLSAIDAGDRAWVAALLSAGADPNATRDHGHTVLMTAAACLCRDVEVLRLLVAHGADPHAVSKYGRNVLHAAIDVNGAEANSPECVREILGYLHGLGVSMEQRDRQGMTPVMLAGCKGTAVENAVLAELLRPSRSRR